MFHKKTSVVIAVLLAYALNAQKPALNLSDLGMCPSVNTPKISRDGRYIIYTYMEGGQQRLVIKSKDGAFEKQILGASSYNSVITENCKYVLAKVKDTLLIVNMDDGQIEIITGISSYKTPPEGIGGWLAYQLQDKSLVVRNLFNLKVEKIPLTTDYMFSNDGEILVVKTESGKDKTLIQWIDLKDNKASIIWKGKRASNLCIDPSGNYLAFIAGDVKDDLTNIIWRYRQGSDSAQVIVTNKTKGVQNELNIRSDELRFNKDGTRLFFYLQPSQRPKPNPDYVSLDVWSYQDAKLMSLQNSEVYKPNRYMCVVDVSTSDSDNEGRTAFRLEQEGDEVTSRLEQTKADYVLVKHRIGDADEYFWNKTSAVSYYLTSTLDGSKRLLKANLTFNESQAKILLSPSEKFVLYYDPELKHYFSYEIATGITRNITSEILVALDVQERDDGESAFYPPSIIGWSKKDESLFLRDKYDIWRIDPLADKSPVCLTNMYGRKQKIRFSLIGEGENNIINEEEQTAISFNTRNKRNGFYRISLSQPKEPKKITEGDYLISKNLTRRFRVNDIDNYLIGKESATEPLNLFVTSDLKNFTQLSDVSAPANRFNWIKTELVKWKTADGKELQGVLYKPENFDSSKKYPVIFHYYERKSDLLNSFIEPQLASGDINIAFFVSNGYLIFSPDIQYTIGSTGKSVYNSVVSAAKFLSKKHWIDSTKMGLQGFSFGGYETYYLITHSNLFAAATAADGPTDLVSFYGSMIRNGYAIKWHEIGQGRLGTTPFANPQIYINNSPVYSADHVIAPLLMMHNKGDYNGLFEQGMEFFNAMRRLGKRCWMLQYDNGNHGVDGVAEQHDYTQRMFQFFNHYLKDSACPRWMLYGIPASQKGIETGYELIKEKDPKTGKWVTLKEGGLLTDEEKKKVEALKHRKPVTVTIE